MVRGIRGAISIKENTREEILEASWELVSTAIKLNNVEVEDISHIIFSATPDINVAFPAASVRLQGSPWDLLACLDVQQMEVANATKGLIRIMMVVNTDRRLGEIIHPYLRGAEKLRPDRKLQK